MAVTLRNDPVVFALAARGDREAQAIIRDGFLNANETDLLPALAGLRRWRWRGVQALAAVGGALWPCPLSVRDDRSVRAICGACLGWNREPVLLAATGPPGRL